MYWCIISNGTIGSKTTKYMEPWQGKLGFFHGNWCLVSQNYKVTVVSDENLFETETEANQAFISKENKAIDLAYKTIDKRHDKLLVFMREKCGQKIEQMV